MNLAGTLTALKIEVNVKKPLFLIPFIFPFFEIIRSVTILV